MKRYSIMVRYPKRDGDVELCQCDTSPEKLVAAAQQRKLYDHVYIRENPLEAD